MTTTLNFGGSGDVVTRPSFAALVNISPFLLAIFLPSTVVLEARPEARNSTPNIYIVMQKPQRQSLDCIRLDNSAGSSPGVHSTQQWPHARGGQWQQQQVRWATGKARGRLGERMPDWRRVAAAAEVAATANEVGYWKGMWTIGGEDG